MYCGRFHAPLLSYPYISCGLATGHTSGNIRWRQRGVYELTVDLPRDPDQGKRRRRTHTFRGNENAAYRRLHELEAAANGIEPEPAAIPPPRDSAVDPGLASLSVSGWMQTWMERWVKRNRAVTTQERYASIIDHHLNPKIGHLDVARVAPSDIEALETGLLDRGLAPKTVHLVHTVLSGAFRYAERLGVVERNPVASVVPPSFDKAEVVPPDVAQVRTLLKLAREEGDSLFPMLQLVVYTGMRRGEVLALRWENVNLEGAHL